MTKRWKLNTLPTGLARVGYDYQHRGSKLYENGVDLASVSYNNGKWNHREAGWYWACATNKELGIEHQNTCTKPVATADEAKKAAKAYINSCKGEQHGTM